MSPDICAHADIVKPTLSEMSSFWRIICKDTFRNGLMDITTLQGVDLIFKFPRRQYLACDGEMSPMHREAASQFIGLKGSTSNMLVPENIAHHQTSHGAHALTGQSCSDGTRGTYTIRLVARFSCYG